MPLLFNCLKTADSFFFYLFVSPPERLLPFTCPHLVFPFSSFFPFPLFFPFFLPEVHPLRMWPQPFSPMLYRICRSLQGNCGKLVPIQSAIQQSQHPVYSLWKTDLPLSVSICRPRNGGHPSKYWPSAKMLDLADRLIPDTDHTPNSMFSTEIWPYVLFYYHITYYTYHITFPCNLKHLRSIRGWSEKFSTSTWRWQHSSMKASEWSCASFDSYSLKFQPIWTRSF